LGRLPKFNGGGGVKVGIDKKKQKEKKIQIMKREQELRRGIGIQSRRGILTNEELDKEDMEVIQPIIEYMEQIGNLFLNYGVDDDYFIYEEDWNNDVQSYVTMEQREWLHNQKIKKQNLLNHIIIIPSIKEENIYGLYLNGVVISLTNQEILYNNKVVTAGGVGSYQPFFNNILDGLDLANQKIEWLNDNKFKYNLLVLLNILNNEAEAPLVLIQELIGNGKLDIIDIIDTWISLNPKTKEAIYQPINIKIETILRSMQDFLQAQQAIGVQRKSEYNFDTDLDGEVLDRLPYSPEIEFEGGKRIKSIKKNKRSQKKYTRKIKNKYTKKRRNKKYTKKKRNKKNRYTKKYKKKDILKNTKKIFRGKKIKNIKKTIKISQELR
jgi:hypothetical protein